jgi:hypothetical protein
MNFVHLSQYNFGVLSGPQSNVAVIAPPPAFLNAYHVSQANVGFGAGAQSNVAVIL